MGTTGPAAPSEAEASALLLAVDEVGPAAHGALLRSFGSALATIDAARGSNGRRRLARVTSEEGGAPALGPGVAEKVVADLRQIDERLAVLRAAGVRIVTVDDVDYPARLREIDLPPPVLFTRGSLAGLHADHVVAVVGTRRPTEHGRAIATRLAAMVAAAGATVVSGLAFGIDGAAHAATADGGAPTVAVLGSGHDCLVPRAHARLAARILATGGAVISEFWPDQPPAQWTFPRRNRVISGLADATVVVEAPDRSGALITAKHALEQGRELFLVPGRLGDPKSAGCLRWLREYPGVARVVGGYPELVEDLGLVEVGPRRSNKPAPPSLEAVLLELGPTARTIAREIVAGRGSLDELVAETALAPATVLGVITLLELRGLAISTFGRYRAAGQLATAPVTETRRRLPRPESPC
jgi:DNA processing protein